MKRTMGKRLRDAYWWLWIHWPRPFRFVHRLMVREERRVEAEEIGRYLLECEAFRERPWLIGEEELHLSDWPTEYSAHRSKESIAQRDKP